MAIMMNNEEFRAEVEARLERYEQQYRTGEAQNFIRRFVFESLGLEPATIGHARAADESSFIGDTY